MLNWNKHVILWTDARLSGAMVNWKHFLSQYKKHDSTGYILPVVNLQSLTLNATNFHTQLCPSYHWAEAELSSCSFQCVYWVLILLLHHLKQLYACAAPFSSSRTGAPVNMLLTVPYTKWSIHQFLQCIHFRATIVMLSEFLCQNQYGLWSQSNKRSQFSHIQLLLISMLPEQVKNNPQKWKSQWIMLAFRVFSTFSFLSCVHSWCLSSPLHMCLYVPNTCD